MAEPTWWRDLDAGLREGYAESERRSVLARIEHLSGPVPRVLLRGEEAAGNGAGRYEVLGEIARGGVGIVLKGRDVDLGRDVAMKVIRPEHAQRPDILERFVEEAQIGGQLQHPGIVPVYELGLREDQSAYFTMKLIKGETLAVLLEARTDPAQDRRRYLGVLEQVCQTVAYAHARGVVHRDLKPSNVMVGAFGEVQVVDWGFAKVLRRGGVADERRTPAASRIRTVRTGSASSQSQAGSILGTPAYMPPEQALGEVELVDQRSDVFALGAILCEILTGLPPYTRTDSEIFLQAAQGDLADAFARLDACAADRDLVDLARRCLSPRRAERPASAADVAAAVGRHLASAEERKRRATLEAAEARVEAQAERKARRLTLGIGGAVLLALACGAAAFLWMDRRQRDRTRQAGRAVSEALQEAGRLRALAQEAAYRDLARWRSAVAAAEHALGLAGDAPAETRDSARAFLAAVVAEEQRARRNAELLARIEETRTLRGDELDLLGADRAYAEVFAPFGLADAEAAARGLRATGIGPELLAALDEWIWLRAQAPELPGRARLATDHLVAVANAADAEPWRARLRHAGAARDRDALLALEASLPAGALEEATARLLALHLSSAGERERAVGLLRRAQRLRPGDFWLNYLLAYELTLLVPPQWQESVHFFRMALAARPDSRQTRHQLGIALLKVEQHGEAIAEWEEALRRAPDFVHLYDHVAEAHERNGTLDRLVARYEREADGWIGLFRLGRALELAGAWDRAVDAYARALELEPDSAFLWTHLGLAHQFAGDLDAALAAHRRALELDPEHVEAWSGIAKVHFQTLDLEQGLLANAEAIRLNPYRPMGYAGRAAFHRLAGDPEEAERWHRLSIEVAPSFSAGYVHLGTTRLIAGDLDGAIDILSRALTLPERYAEGRYGLTVRTRRASGEPETRHAVLGFVPEVILAYRHLAFAHTARGDLDAAADAWRGHLARQPGAARSLYREVLMRQGDWERAEAELRATLDAEPDAPLARYSRCFALLGLGRLDEAEEELRRFAGHPLWPPDLRARWEEESPRLVPLARELPSILDGTRAWTSAREKALAAWLCQELAYHARAARLYEEAFAAEPELAAEPMPWPVLWHRAGAAAQAALNAGWGIGRDATEERRRWRLLARAWMEKDLALWDARGDRAGFARSLGNWLRVMPLYELARAPSNLAALPDDERAAWTELWDAMRAHQRALGGRDAGK